MIFAQVRSKSQITIPHKIMIALRIKEGDVLEISAEMNKITLKPKAVMDLVTLSPQGEKLLRESLQDVRKGKTKTFDSVEKLIGSLEK